MASLDDLKVDVEILLEKSTLVGHEDARSASGQPVNLGGPNASISSSSEDYEITHKQVASLKKLFFQSNKEKQIEILRILSDNINKGGQISRTVCLTLIETGNVQVLIDLIRDNFNDHTQHGYNMAIQLLNGYIYYFWPKLTLSQVRDIREWAAQAKSGTNNLGQAMGGNPVAYGQIIQFINSIYHQTTHILAEDVEARIDTGYNPEINIDREEVKQEVRRFGFPEDLSITLDKIDLKFSQANDAFDFKGCMDLIRSFTERLYRSVLDTYGEEGKKVDEKDSEKTARFFESKGLVSDHFANMIAQQRHFLSDQGSHRLKSREEDARLSKNMVIEMSLYLLRRFENH